MKDKTNSPIRSAGEGSFTLVETLVAMIMMTMVIVNVVGTQGAAIYNADYGRRISQAMWLAKGVMSKVEYYWNTQELKKLGQEGKVSGRPFKGDDWPMAEDSDYTFNLTIEEFKFPLFDLLEKGGPGGDDDSEKPSQGFPIKDIVKNILGDHILKLAHVEVFWPEGARQNSVSLVYLMTNQRKMDEALLAMRATYDQMMKAIKAEHSGKKKVKIRTKAECQKIDSNNRWDTAKKICLDVDGKEVKRTVKAKPKPKPENSQGEEK
tara:strand:- start:90 stop:881 length:792 start_codon:yes stop_codon:yes gene_type:complete